MFVKRGLVNGLEQISKKKYTLYDADLVIFLLLECFLQGGEWEIIYGIR